jgi:hypothetical protein
MARAFKPPATGWLRDQPDFRDFTLTHERIRPLLRQPDAYFAEAPRATSVDLREFFPETRDQGTLPAASAIACASLFDYYDFRCSGRRTHASPLFVHLNAHRTNGAAGASLRASIKAITRYGLPTETLFPYDCALADREPPSFLYCYPTARDIFYLRLDAPSRPTEVTLATLKRFLARGFPAVFGFPVPSSITDDPDIPYRPTYDAIIGWQAAVAVGYDDRRQAATSGALLVRNSWGPDWGDNGYGWLPYSYVLDYMALDVWALISDNWISTSTFELLTD